MALAVRRCQQSPPVTDFSTDMAQHDGLSSRCKGCVGHRGDGTGETDAVAGAGGGVVQMKVEPQVRI